MPAIKIYKKNMTEVTQGEKKILFSYRTPVVVFHQSTYYVTTEFFSRTTTRQIQEYLRDQTMTGRFAAFNTKRVSQDEIAKLSGEQ